MPDSLLSKSFSEGAPLDPNALNALVTDIKNTYAKTDILLSKTENGQQQNYKFKFDCGYIGPVNLSAGQSSAIPLNLSAGFNADQDIIVSLTVGTNPGSKNNINAYAVKDSRQNYNVFLNSNAAINSVIVYWTATQKIPV